MPIRLTRTPLKAVLFLAPALCGIPHAMGASCKTQSQLTSAERDALATTARIMAGDVQTGNVQALQTITMPAVAADFTGIAGSVATLKPLLEHAAITVDSLYLLDASTEPAGAPRTDFYCGSPVVVLNFTDLPPGSYALAIVHATGVAQPQQISLVLWQSADHRWMLGGFFSKPMTEAGHDGLWYWVSARKFAEQNMPWASWFYYRLATDFLQPVSFLSSPNLDKLQREEDKIHPTDLPAAQHPLMVGARGTSFQVTDIDTTTTFGPLDLEVHYAPDPAQTSQLRDPPTARKQVTALMNALLSMHPELQNAFHGIWVQADGGSGALFSLELPMNEIVPNSISPPVASNNGVH
jgi:hypothetical protein